MRARRVISVFVRARPVQKQGSPQYLHQGGVAAAGDFGGQLVAVAFDGLGQAKFDQLVAQKGNPDRITQRFGKAFFADLDHRRQVMAESA
jgi:hypothetical protein